MVQVENQINIVHEYIKLVVQPILHLITLPYQQRVQRTTNKPLKQEKIIEEPNSLIVIFFFCYIKQTRKNARFWLYWFFHFFQIKKLKISSINIRF